MVGVFYKVGFLLGILGLGSWLWLYFCVPFNLPVNWFVGFFDISSSFGNLIGFVGDFGDLAFEAVEVVG